MASQSQPLDIRVAVRERYSGIAERAADRTADRSAAAASCACCDPADPGAELLPSQLEALYSAPDVGTLPVEVTELSLGCGDPVTLAELQPGQTVIDLGSGGGIDCFLAARRVGPAGRVIGVDMTPSMIERARENQARLKADNVEFRLGEIEHLPVGNEVADVVISNCVINLSPDKPQVLQEAYRVLKPGGKLAVSDIVTSGPLPESARADLAAWTGCVAGALEVTEYIEIIRSAGFEGVVVDRISFNEQPEPESELEIELKPRSASGASSLADLVYSARITAVRPADR